MLCGLRIDDLPPIAERLGTEYHQPARTLHAAGTHGAGESMDIGAATPAGSPIAAFLFDTYATFELFGRNNELRLCVGITKPELQFKMEHGTEKLLAILKHYGVYPFTDLERNSVPLDG